jgi:hypothetical protein
LALIARTIAATWTGEPDGWAAPVKTGPPRNRQGRGGHILHKQGHHTLKPPMKHEKTPLAFGPDLPYNKTAEIKTLPGW